MKLPTHPMIVVCRVTTRCNLACGFCAYDRRLAFERGTITDAAIERLIELLRAHRAAHAQPVLLSWLGGEPLLWARWQHWSAHAQARGLEVSATTNGSTLRQPAVRAAILRNFSELTISIDALATTHNELRGWPGGFERICAGIAALVDERSRSGARLMLRVNVVLMRSTLPQFPTLARRLNALGIDEISLNLLGGRDRPEFHANEAPTAEALERFWLELPELRAQLKQELAAAAAPTTATAAVAAPARANPMRILGDAGYQARLVAASRGEGWPMADCRPGEQFLFVDERGRIAPCAFTGDALGVGIFDIERLDVLPSRFRARRACALPQVCTDCPSTQLAGKFAHPAGVDFSTTPSALRIPESA